MFQAGDNSVTRCRPVCTTIPMEKSSGILFKNPGSVQARFALSRKNKTAKHRRETAPVFVDETMGLDQIRSERGDQTTDLGPIGGHFIQANGRGLEWSGGLS